MQKELVKTAPTQKLPLKSQVQEILSVITAFSNLLVKETEALRKADFKTVDTLQADKRVFAKQYDAKVIALVARKDELLTLDLAVREMLVKERTRFNKVLSENMHALELAQNSTKRLVNRILEVARQSIMDEQQTNYSKTGKTMAYSSASKSLTIDQTL